MVSVGRVGGPAVPAGGARRATGGGGFAVSAQPAGAAPPPVAAAGASAVDGMLLLQQVEDGPTRDRHARRHGRAMLEGLAELQRGLLDGDLDPDALQRLAALVQHCPDASDPALRATLAAVSLRVQLELARRAM